MVLADKHEAELEKAYSDKLVDLRTALGQRLMTEKAKTRSCRRMMLRVWAPKPRRCFRHHGRVKSRQRNEVKTQMFAAFQNGIYRPIG